MAANPSAPADDEDFVPVAEFPSLGEAEGYALVILAMGLSCWILRSPSGTDRRFLVLADQRHAEAVREEFAAYAREQRKETVKPIESPVFDKGLELALLWVLALFAVFYFQVRDPAVTDRFSNASLALMDRGEWWRPFTAMFLHADFPHLLGNMVFGFGFCLLVAHSIGPGLGWSLVLASGTLANIMTAWWRYPAPQSSLGASTATFAALGILVGCGAFAAWKSHSYRKLKGIIAPVGAGVCLLGWLGAGAPPTDVLGHLFGFLIGCFSGLVAAFFRSSK